MGLASSIKNSDRSVKKAIQVLEKKLGHTDYSLLSSSRLVGTDSSQRLVSISALSGYVSGTANQVIVADDGDGTLTLALPQDYDTGATPTLADLTLSAPSNIYSLNHDSFTGFVANKHIDHTSVTLTAGTGLTGGGDISANRTFAVDGVLEDLDTLGANSADSEFLVGAGAGALAWESGATVRTSLGLAIGTDVLAQQTIGIADDNLLEVDDADAADNDYAKFTANGLEGRSSAEVLSDLSASATAAFDLNGQDLTNGGVIFLTEQASAEADVAGKGQVWVKTATPNELWFTDDAGTDTQLGVGGSPGGADTQVQFNDGGSFGGSANLVWDDTNLALIGALEIKSGNELRLYDVGSSHYTGFEAPALTASQIYVLPTADGTTGQFLSTNASGTLSWASAVVYRGDPATWDWQHSDLTIDDAYHDLDCSSIVPAGATHIIFVGYMRQDTTAGAWMKIRKNGQSNDYVRFAKRCVVANVYDDFWGVVACDTDRKVEYAVNNAAGNWTIRLTVAGWFF